MDQVLPRIRAGETPGGFPARHRLRRRRRYCAVQQHIPREQGRTEQGVGAARPYSGHKMDIFQWEISTQLHIGPLCNAVKPLSWWVKFRRKLRGKFRASTGFSYGLCKRVLEERGTDPRANDDKDQ
jgi:hypothetical protein